MIQETNDLFIARLDKGWHSETRKDPKKRSYQALSEILRMLVQYISDPVTGIPEDWIKTIEQKIIYLEEHLDDMSLKAVGKTAAAVNYARRRITKSVRTPKHGRGFKTAISAAERDRADRTLNSAFVSGIKHAELAPADPFDLSFEQSSDDLDSSIPGLD